MADLEHLWPPFRAKVEALLADPDAVKMGVYVVSAFRSVDLQRQLYADAVKKYGPANAGTWVAPPGRSNHGPMVDAHGHAPGPYGRAVDFGVPGVPAASGKWPAKTKVAMDRLGVRYQMHSPMTWEDWHFEPDPSLYVEPTITPGGVMARFPNAVDACWSPNGGVWVLGSDGGVGAYGGAPFPNPPQIGSYPGLPSQQRKGDRAFLRIVPSTLPGKLYDCIADDGSVYSFPA